MDKDQLNNLKIGENLVEIQECTLHGKTVYEVTKYSKEHGFLGIPKIMGTTYPFYFTTIELAQKFLKYSSYFTIYLKHPEYSRVDNYLYLQLKKNPHNKLYVMVDDYNLSYNKIKYQLGEGGIWNGAVNDYDKCYLNHRYNVNFMQIFNNAHIGLKTDKTYIFKMIEENN